VSIEKPTVKSHEKGAIVATFNTKSFTGRRGATLTVTIDKPYRAEIQLHVNGVILGDLSVEPGSVQLGTVDQGTPAETKITVSRSGRSDWKIVDVRCANTALTCEPVETRRSAGQVSYQLLVRLRGDAPAGYINDHLILVTNDRQASQVPVAVSGAVRPSLSVSPASLFLGTVRAGETVTRQFVVKGTRPFRILSIDCGDARFEFDTTGADQPRPLHLVPVKFTADADIGELSRTIRVKTDLGDAAPRLSAVAVIHSAGE
jgi:hypothetical protein